MSAPRKALWGFGAWAAIGWPLLAILAIGMVVQFAPSFAAMAARFRGMLS
ncbi:MAG: hypothetical protein WC829_02215 [Hyphomicrobium sp.]|jgi:hypothetical protein